MQMVRKLQMMVKYTVRGGGAQGYDCHQQTIGPVFANYDNRSDLDHLGDFITPEVANQYAAFLGLISKWHP